MYTNIHSFWSCSAMGTNYLYRTSFMVNSILTSKGGAVFMLSICLEAETNIMNMKVLRVFINILLFVLYVIFFGKDSFKKYQLGDTIVTRNTEPSSIINSPGKDKTSPIQDYGQLLKLSLLFSYNAAS